MSPKAKTPVLAGTGALDCSAGRLNTQHHSEIAPEIQLQVARLRHRYGLSRHRARLIAGHAFGGRNHG